MPRRLSFLMRLLAALLFVQAVVAPAHCLAMASAPAGMEAVICSASGTRMVHLGPDGQEVPAHEAAGGTCLACPLVAQGALPEGPRPPAPSWAMTGMGWHASPAENLPPPARAPPFAPRGPPAFG